jgi:serine/threonine-protein kinase
MLYHRARSSDPAERAALLDQACSDDPALRAEVESLLQQELPSTPALDVMAAQIAASTPAAAIGARIGPHTVRALIGEGGMGQVYRAHDGELGRDVAIKVLPPIIALDPAWRARFEREARVLASLNHPHIGAIYGIAEGDGLRGLVLELVEGDTLNERLHAQSAGKGLPLEATLRIARQIAEALDAAHEKGIVHRDLKPANIKITPDDVVKVLDFGLAKAADSPADPREGLTQAGLIMGTASYMSPEQARGQPVDKRTDIWAFGCILYEMLTGRAAFQRETVADTLAAVVQREIDWSALPTSVPAAVRQLLARCLEKDSKRRLRDIGDARVELEIKPGEAETHPVFRPTRIRLALIGAGALAAAAIVAYFLWNRPFPAEQAKPRVVRFSTSIEAPDWLGLNRPTVAVSPDGSRVVYLNRNDASRKDASTELYIRAADEFEGHPIQGTRDGSNPFFAPDGKSIGFFANRKLKTLFLDGGSPVDVADVESVPLGATWSAAGSIVLGSMDGSTLMRVPASGGQPSALTPAQADGSPGIEAWPEALPDGKSVLFTVMPTGEKPAYVAVASLVTGTRKTLFEGSAAHYLSRGYLVYMRGSSLMGIRFDSGTLEVIGTPVLLLDNVRQEQGAGAAQFSASANAETLVYVAGARGNPVSNLVLVDRKGQAQVIAPPARPYSDPRVSADGQRIAVDLQENGGSDIWVYDVPRATWSQLTFNDQSLVPVWTPDGKYITFVITANGGSKVYWKAADGSGPDELLFSSAGNPHAWSRDGQYLVGTGTIGVLRLDAHRKAVPYLASRPGGKFAAPAFSPDEHWIAYVSNESGRNQVYVTQFPNWDTKWLVSSDGGTQPMWSRNGHELFYRDGDKMMVVSVTTGSAFIAEQPKLLFEAAYESIAVRANYDVMPDGRFLMIKADAQQSTNRRLNLVLNWNEELKRLMPAAR